MVWHATSIRRGVGPAWFPSDPYLTDSSKSIFNSLFGMSTRQGTPKVEKSHAPQDFIYGPLNIPWYCWQIIDTPEFQRLRFIKQLGPAYLVYATANHTRFEHSLGCCHLATIFMDTIKKNDRSLVVTEKQKQAVILAALCHDIGHGPFSHAFDAVARTDETFREIQWQPVDMSEAMFRYILEKHGIHFSDDVVKAACNFILGHEYKEWPRWLSQIVRNLETNIDLNTFDYVMRDNRRTLNTSTFHYYRLISSCRVVEGKLSWKLCEVPTIESLLYTRNELYMRVYYDQRGQAALLMIQDIFKEIFQNALGGNPHHLELREYLMSPGEFAKLDDRIMYQVERGDYGEKAKALAYRIMEGNLYPYVGQVTIKADNKAGVQYSQNDPGTISEDVAPDNFWPALRVLTLGHKFGVENTNPLLKVHFWRQGSNDQVGSIQLEKGEISSVLADHFGDTQIRLFVVDQANVTGAKEALEILKEKIKYPEEDFE